MGTQPPPVPQAWDFKEPKFCPNCRSENISEMKWNWHSFYPAEGSPDMLATYCKDCGTHFSVHGQKTFGDEGME